ncbi:MAG: Ser-Thr-rich GPI-anchored membrane family protein [Candidatus Nealsonbacteria bacterium]
MGKRKRMDKRIEKRMEKIIVSGLGIALVVCMIMGIISLVRSYTREEAIVEEATVEEFQAQVADLKQQLAELQAQLQTQQPLTLLSPNSGEKWVIGKTYQIKWQSIGVNKVTIELLSADVRKTITSFPNNPGFYNWTISSDIVPNDKYKIRVISYELSPAISDLSDDYFSIVERDK